MIRCQSGNERMHSFAGKLLRRRQLPIYRVLPHSLRLIMFRHVCSLGLAKSIVENPDAARMYKSDIMKLLNSFYYTDLNPGDVSPTNDGKALERRLPMKIKSIVLGMTECRCCSTRDECQ